jgi:glutamate synthase (NADPH/NADH) large chain
MSGGIAYVLDLVADRVNREMVDLEPLDEGDEAFVKDLVGRHLAETGSAVAERLLADWDAAAARFTKIMPRDYRRVLEAMAEAEAQGRDVDEAVMAAAQG